jgi:ASC-1-like (ASCH) protein
VLDSETRIIGQTMCLNKEAFNLIKDGNKTIESRLLDRKRKLLKVDDIIEFINNNTEETFKASVTELLHYKIFREMFDNHDPSEFGGNNIKHLIDSVEAIYEKKMKEGNYEVLGIRVQIL